MTENEQLALINRYRKVNREFIQFIRAVKRVIQRDCDRSRTNLSMAIRLLVIDVDSLNFAINQVDYYRDKELIGHIYRILQSVNVGAHTLTQAQLSAFLPDLDIIKTWYADNQDIREAELVLMKRLERQVACTA